MKYQTRLAVDSATKIVLLVLIVWLITEAFY